MLLRGAAAVGLRGRLVGALLRAAVALGRRVNGIRIRLGLARPRSAGARRGHLGDPPLERDPPCLDLSARTKVFPTATRPLGSLLLPLRSRERLQEYTVEKAY